MLRFHCFKKSAYKELGMKNGQFDLQLDCGRKSNSPKSILENIISGEYKHNACKIEYNKKDGKWYFILTYTMEIDDYILLDSNKTLGIDLGIKYVAYGSVYNAEKQKYEFIRNNTIEGGEITHFRNKIEARKNSMLKQYKHCGDGRKGHGRKTALKPIEKLNGKVENFRKTCNHRYSRFIVDMAVKNNCGNIVMENLSGIGEQSAFLKRWSYFELQQMVIYKAKEYNINVSLIDPSYTSQRCSECGHIHKDSRKTQEKFVCVSCGHSDNADRNASKNIALPNIENIIKNTEK